MIRQRDSIGGFGLGDHAAAKSISNIDTTIPGKCWIVSSQLRVLFLKSLQPTFALIGLSITVRVAQPYQLAC